VPILKKLCVYKNLDRLFYLCINVLKSENVFPTVYYVNNSLTSESFFNVTNSYLNQITSESLLNAIPAYSNQILSEVWFKAFISVQNEISHITAIPKPVIKYIFIDNEIVSRLPIRGLGFEILEELLISSKAVFSFVLPEKLKIVLSPLVSITLKPSTTLEVGDYTALLRVISLNIAESVKTSSSASLPLTYLAKPRTNISISDVLSYKFAKVLNSSTSVVVSDYVSPQFIKSIHIY
jgi:hypothetical protein